MNSLTYEQFSLMQFRTEYPKEEVVSEGVEPFAGGVLAIVNSGKVDHLFIKFKDVEGRESYCHADGVPLGSTLSIGNDPKDIKAQSLSDDQIAQLDIRVARVVSCSLQQIFMSHQYAAKVELDMGIGSTETCSIPDVSPDLMLAGKKIIVLSNLKQECIYDPKVHVLCAVSSQDSFWHPFLVTNQQMAAGTRASL